MCINKKQILNWCCKICSTRKHTLNRDIEISRHYIKFYFILFRFVCVCVSVCVLKCNSTRIHQHTGTHTDTYRERRRHSNRYIRMLYSMYTFRKRSIRGKCTWHGIMHLKKCGSEIGKFRAASRFVAWYMQCTYEYADKINKQANVNRKYAYKYTHTHMHTAVIHSLVRRYHKDQHAHTHAHSHTFTLRAYANTHTHIYTNTHQRCAVNICKLLCKRNGTVCCELLCVLFASSSSSSYFSYRSLYATHIVREVNIPLLYARFFLFLFPIHTLTHTGTYTRYIYYILPQLI